MQEIKVCALLCNTHNPLLSLSMHKHKTTKYIKKEVWNHVRHCVCVVFHTYPDMKMTCIIFFTYQVGWLLYVNIHI